MNTCLLGTWAYFMHTIINYQYNGKLYHCINWLAWYITKYCIILLRLIFFLIWTMNSAYCQPMSQLHFYWSRIIIDFYRTVSSMNWTSYKYISKLSIYWYLKYLIVEPTINNYKYNKRWYTYSSHHLIGKIISWLEYNYM